MKKTAIALAIALGALSGSASALTIDQLTAANPIFQIEDDSVESIHVDAGNDKILQVGDTLRGVAEFPSFINLVTSVTTLLTPLLGNSNLGALFEAEVTSITTSGDEAPGRFDISFGANAAFGASIGYAGAVIAFYESNVDNINMFSCGTVGPGGTCEASVTDGNLILVLGFAGDVDEFWFAENSPLNTTAPTAFKTTSALGEFNFGLSVLYSTIGQYNDISVPVNFADGVGDDKVEWLGSGSILGTQNALGQQVTAYSATDDTQLAASRIPEPATLGLLGLGLLGMAGLRRRKSA